MNRWRDPNKQLPVTKGGEKNKYTVRVPVEVILSDGTQEIVQFRRYLYDGKEEKGGAFCGFKGTDALYLVEVDSDFQEYWKEWIAFGDTRYIFWSPDRTVLKWRYVGKGK